jgi:hypothetical protein
LNDWSTGYEPVGISWLPHPAGLVARPVRLLGQRCLRYERDGGAGRFLGAWIPLRFVVEEELTHLTPERRRALRVWGIIISAVGYLMFFSVPLMMVLAFGSRVIPPFPLFIVFAFGGVILIAVGRFLLRFGFMKPMAEIMATETGGAVEYSSERMAKGIGKGLKGAGLNLGAVREVVKVKCRKCGFLETEDAKYCSSCAKPM